MYWTFCLLRGPPRVNHAADVIGDRIYSVGGYCTDEDLPAVIDIHVFETDMLVWKQIQYSDSSDAPPGLYGHSVVVHRGLLYLWGGQNNFNSSDKLFCFHPGTSQWNVPNAYGCKPRATDGHSACVMGNYMYVFGGYESEGEAFSRAVYRVDLLTYEWQLVNTKGEPPSGRDFHTASVVGHRMYIFGGRSCFSEEMEEEYYPKEIMYLDTRSMTWVTPACTGQQPCGRRSHSAVVYKDDIFIFGGLEGIGETHLNDVFKYIPASSTWYKITIRGPGPSPRRRHCSVVIGDQLYLFGGSSPVNEMPGQHVHHGHLDLHEHSDMHVMDFFPSLRRLSQLKVILSNLDISSLPGILQQEIRYICTKQAPALPHCSKCPESLSPEDFTTERIIL